MQENTSKVYVMTDEQNRIIRCEGGYTTPKNLTGWILIDQGTGDKYDLCQRHYFAGGLYTDTTPSIPRFKLVDGAPVLRSDEEIEADRQPNIADLRAAKTAEMSAACNAAINAGTTVQMPDGTQEAFTYSTADQANVSEMFMACLMGAESYPYHANDEPCQSYTAAEIMAIYGTLSMYKTGQLTYHNQLKQYIGTLETVQEVQAVTYGQELTGEYLVAYGTLMQEAQAQMQAVISKVGGADATG